MQPSAAERVPPPPPALAYIPRPRPRAKARENKQSGETTATALDPAPVCAYPPTPFAVHWRKGGFSQRPKNAKKAPARWPGVVLRFWTLAAGQGITPDGWSKFGTAFMSWILSTLSSSFTQADF